MTLEVLRAEGDSVRALNFNGVATTVSGALAGRGAGPIRAREVTGTGVGEGGGTSVDATARAVPPVDGRLRFLAVPTTAAGAAELKAGAPSYAPTLALFARGRLDDERAISSLF